LDRNTKERVAVELHKKLDSMKLAVLADYSGVNVTQMTDLRNKLRETDSEMRVVKNNLFRLASKDTGFCVLDEYLKGPLSVVMNAGDVASPAKVLVKFAKDNAEFEIKCGVLDGKLLSKEQISMLAELPSKEVLIAKLLSVFVGTQTKLVNVLSGVPRSFVQVIDAYRSTKGKEN
jgi:large subunit ribosomal protein L10